MLLPIGDDDRDLSGPAYVCVAIIIANILVFLIFQQAGGNDAFNAGYSAIPFELTQGVDLVGTRVVRAGAESVQIQHTPGPVPIHLTLLTSMFMHGGIMHLAGNILFLWIFGDNIEHRFGHVPFFALYLVSGLAAMVGQVLLDPSSVVPNLGASGAISGVMGAYLVLFPRNRVYAVFFFVIVTVPAVVVLGAWIFFQVIDGFGALSGQQIGGIAYGAHIGGFIAGLVLAMILRQFISEKQSTVFSRATRSDRSRRVR
ncbi:MAG: rhomboid family intramembrane serine protease [Rhodothermales bacterium]|nr:rhomboid family intramembrane serine protease [Rhodothermales bacterium]